FTHSPDYTHHTSEDTPDKVDPEELERSELIAAATALYLAGLSGTEAVDLAHLVAANGAARLAAAARTARHRVLAAGTDTGSRLDAALAIDQQQWWEREALADVTHFSALPLVRDRVAALQRGLEDRAKELARLVEADARALGLPRARRGDDTRIPVRLTRGPLDFSLPEGRLPPDSAAWYASDAFTLSGEARFELVNFVDGARTVSQIRDALSAEFGGVEPSVVSRYVEDLVRVGVMRWK
ncbi:MAG TPA: hypothetical protein VFH97_02000, partial [Gemmatimonadales bacterium]|nr:hypothetical protein [Gemmatimonadales bacterium]